MKTISTVFLLIISLTLNSFAQADLLAELENSQDTAPAPVFSTFKGTKIINGQSVETRKAGNLEFLIEHRFGTLNSGATEFFGLDQAQIRLGLSYAITDRLTMGIGRSSFNKIVDGNLKFALKKQSDRFPLSMTLFTNMGIKTFQPSSEENLSVLQRSAFAHQLLIAHKWNSKFSFQLSPTWVHENRISAADNSNDTFSIGFGGRYKLNKRTALVAEYFLNVNNRENPNKYDALAIGVDIETGGHVFQIHLTNAQQVIPQGFITDTRGNFWEGDIHLGFNISRDFGLGKAKKKKW